MVTVEAILVLYILTTLQMVPLSALIASVPEDWPCAFIFINLLWTPLLPFCEACKYKLVLHVPAPASENNHDEDRRLSNREHNDARGKELAGLLKMCIYIK